MNAIDLFAGAGGFTQGLTSAGVEVVWAANHWPTAVSTHQLAHPDVVHSCEDLTTTDWTGVPPHDLLVASPACQGHSTASQPARRRFHDGLRATAWVVTEAVEVCRPQAGFIVENVPSFARWELFDLWCESFRALGYRVDVVTLVASAFGVPQRRARLFVVGTPTASKPPNLAFDARPEPGFGPSIDPAGSGWMPTTEASAGVKTRVAAGRARWGKTFLSQWTTGHSGVPLSEPIRTVTTAANHWNLVDGDRYRPLNDLELKRAMGFPDDYPLTGTSKAENTRLLGNAVCPPVASALAGRLAA